MSRFGFLKTIAAVVCLAVGGLQHAELPVRAADTFGEFDGPRDVFAVAAGHYRLQNWTKAAKSFGEFASRFPQDPLIGDALYFWGEALVQANLFSEAVDRYATLIRSDPQHRYIKNARFRHGETAYFADQWQVARAALADFHQRYPKDVLNAYALNYLAATELILKQPQRAEKHYLKGLELYAASSLATDYRLGLGRTYQAMGNHREARRFLTMLAGDRRLTVADDAQLQIGISLQSEGLHPQAVQAFDQLSATFPDSELVADAAYWKGRSLAALKNWEAAAKVLSDAASRHTDHKLAPAICYEAAEANQQLKQTAKARVQYQRVVRQWPQSQSAPDSLVALARISFELNDLPALSDVRDQLYQRINPADDDSELVTQRTATRRPEPGATDLPQHGRAVDLLWGRLLLKNSQSSQAVAVFEKLYNQALPAPAAPTATLDAADATNADNATTPRADGGQSVPQNSVGDDESIRYYLALSYLANRQADKSLQILDSFDGQPATAILPGLLAARATAHMQLKQYDQAIKANQDYLRQFPTGKDAVVRQRQIVSAEIQRHDLNAALKELDALRDLDKQKQQLLPATRQLAEAFFAAKRYERSQELFKQLAGEGNPPKLVAVGLSGMAWCQHIAGKSADSTIEVIQQLISRFPDSPLAAEAAMLQAATLEKQQKPEAALPLYELVISKYATTRHLPDALLAAARIQDRLQRDTEADDLLVRLLGDFPDYANRDAALYARAWVLQDRRQTDESLKMFAEVVKLHPQSDYWADAAFRLAEQAAKRNQLAEAQKLLTAAVAKGEGDVRAHALLLQSQLSAQSGDWRESIQPLERLIADDPAGSLAVTGRFWLAEAHYRLGEIPEAKAYYKKLGSLANGEHRQWAPILALREAQILGLEKKWDTALSLAEKAAQQWPTFDQRFELDYLIGRCLGAAGRFREARAAYQKVVRSATGGETETAAMAAWMIGETWFHQKHYAEAIEAYTRAYGRYSFPKWRAAALLQSGKCYEMQGQWGAAKKHYDRLLDEFPDSNYHEQAQQRLSVVRQRAELAEKQNPKS